jgi:hypothetical protein
VDLSPAGGGNAVVNRFDVGDHSADEPIGYERVVIGLQRPAATYRAAYVRQIVQDGSGFPVTLRGDADLEVRLDGALSHDDNGASTVPVRRYLRDWRSLREATVVSDFEGTVVIGLGLSRQVDFQMFTLTAPDRLVIDLALPGERPWECTGGLVQVYFFDEPRFLANTEPFFTPVWRRVPTPAVAGGALRSLFMGPLPTEFGTGRRLLASGATGFTGLRIADGTAHVRLVGGCDSGGATVTIAGSIFPTLKQFPSVRYVKIYDPSGGTGNPTGPGDSIPDCLNP